MDPYFEAVRTAQADPEAAALLNIPAMTRRIALQMNPCPSYIPPDVTKLTTAAPGPHGDVALNVYQPVGSGTGTPRPLVVWCHGGGWVEGGHDTPDGDCEAIELSARLDAVVVSPDYHLAIEGVYYPLPVDDVLAAWAHSLDNAADWGATTERTTLGGGSAGANIAAGTALRLRDSGGTLPSVLVLNVPPLHAHLPKLTKQERRDLELTEVQEDMWRLGIRLAFENYQGAPADEAPIYVAPGMADPTGLPPTLIISCEYDILRASAREFAQSLRSAGVPHKIVLYPGVGHGHTAAPWLPAAQEAYREIAAWVSGH